MTEAQSGKEALKLLEAGQLPDVVITDHAMPHMTGVELRETIGRLYPDLEVVLATGYAELPHGAKSGAIRLSKPFTQAQLSAALAEASASKLRS